MTIHKLHLFRAIFVLIFLTGCFSKKGETNEIDHIDIATASPSLEYTRGKNIGRGAIREAALSPDEDILAVATELGIWLYDVETLEPRQLLENEVGVIAWSPDSTQLLIWKNRYYGWTAYVIDIETGKERQRFDGDTVDVGNVTWSPDSTRIAFPSRDSFVHVWDIRQEEELFVLDAKVEGSSPVVWSPDGNSLATGGTGLVAVWDTANGKKRYEYEFDLGGYGYNWVQSMAWSSGGEFLAFSAGNSSYKWIWSVTKDTVLELPHLASLTYSIAWSPDDSRLAFAGSDIQILDVVNMQEQLVLRSYLPQIKELMWLSTGIHLLAVGVNRIELWDVESGHLVRTVDEHVDANGSAIWSPDSKQLALLDSGTTKLWDIASGDLVLVLEVQLYKNMTVWSPDSTKLVGWSFVDGGDINQDGLSEHDWRVQLLETTNGQVLFSVNDLENNAVQSARWTIDGIRLVSNRYEGIRIWDPISGQQLAAIELDYGSWSALSLSPEGDIVTYIEEGNTIHLWEVESSQEIQVLNGLLETQNELIWSPDGERLAATGSSPTIQVWDVLSGELLFWWESENENFVSVTWSPDSKKFAAIQYSGKVFIWDVISGRQLHTLEVNIQIGDVSWSPDGTKLAIFENSGRVQIWCLKRCDL